MAPFALRRSALSGLAAALVALLSSTHASAITAEVVWLDAKCDYVLVKNEDGHAILFRASPFDLKLGDKLEGAMDQVGYFRKMTKVGTAEMAMMRSEKYGVRRQLAVNLMMDWSRYCEPPAN